MSADDEIEVFRVYNPAVLDVWPFSDLIETAFTREHSPTDPETARHKLHALIPAGTLALLIARQGNAYRGLCLIGMPRVSFGGPAALLYYLYSDGDRRIGGELARQGAKLAADSGYARIIATNSNGRDAAFERLVRPYLGRGQPRGTAYHFDLGGDG